MKTLFARPLITLTVAASVALLAGCLDQPRPTVSTVPPAAPAPAVPVSEPQVVVRPNPAAANVSAPIAEIARLHQAGLDESVVKAFVEKSTNSISPTADELIYLKDIGVSPRIVTTHIQQTARSREQAAAAVPAPVPAPIVPAPPAPAAPAATPAPVAVAAAPAPAPAVPAFNPQVIVTQAPLPIAQPAPAELPPQINVFYQQLQPYGTWLQVAEHGWCWQPSVAIGAAGWRPYCDRGRWLYTDHGWYWQSDYAWGWAPFHYGRWVLHARSGWLWVPDTTWGPAWVVWRSSEAHCGWAPLPPSAVWVAGRGLLYRGSSVSISFDFELPHSHYTFVPFGRFCDRNPHYYAVAPGLGQNLYRGTTVINNIQVNNNVIINQGVPAERVALLTRSEVRKVSVRETPANEPNGLQRLDKLEKSGNDLVIYRPSLNPGAPVKPVTLTNAKGETRTELVPVGAATPQKIAGRPVYDTTSTGVPVLTGYTTEPAAPPARKSTVIVNPPAPTTPAPPAPTPVQAPQVTKVFGVSPDSLRSKRTEVTNAPVAAVSAAPSPDNSLFRPLTPPTPVTSAPQPLTPPTTIAPSHSSFSHAEPPRPVVQPTRVSPPSVPLTPSAQPAPVAPPRPTVTLPPQPAYQPPPSSPAPSRSATVITPSSQPTSPGSANSTKTEQEKKKDR